MSSIFHGMNFQKTDLNTKKELEEDCWRKAENEDLHAFLGFYIDKKGSSGGINATIIITAIIFFVLVAEFLFELLLRSDPSYNPIPIVVAMIAVILILLFLMCMRELSLRKMVQNLNGCVYVTEAVAYGMAGNKVQVMVNKKRLAFDEYTFDETVSPTDYIFDEDGRSLGFRVSLYVVIQNNSCVMKAVLGSHGYRHFAEKYRHFMKIK